MIKLWFLVVLITWVILNQRVIHKQKVEGGKCNIVSRAICILNLSLGLVLQIKLCDKLLRFIPSNCAYLFLCSVHGTSPCDKMKKIPKTKLVPATSSLVCLPLVLKGLILVTQSCNKSLQPVPHVNTTRGL